MDVLDVKKFVLEHKLQEVVSHISFLRFIESYYHDDDSLIDDIDDRHRQFINTYGLEVYNTCVRLNNNLFKRKFRVKERITAMLNHGTCLFMTFTFSQDTLASTTYDKRRRYVREWLKSNSDYYLANIDFGKTTGREHYHAVILCDYVDVKSFKYGFIWAQRIVDNSKSIDCISSYVPKLVNHSLKESTGRLFPLIYSKKLIDLVK